MTPSSPTTGHGSVTDAQQQTWASGDFHEIARHNVVMAERSCPAVRLRAGERVLDVACGSGTVALVAARHHAEVTGIDFVPELIERAKERANAEGYEVELRVADAQDLPFEDDSFDVVLSIYGVHFAPDQERAANEMLRVCRPGGRIGLASPMPEGWSGDLFGPTLSALERLEPERRDDLLRDIGEVFRRYNRADDGTAVVENTYLQTVAIVA